MVWIIAFVLFITIEFLTVNLVTIWFAIGALIAYLISYLTSSFIIQTITFFVISILALLLTKPLVKKIFNSSDKDFNINCIIGQVGTATTPILKDLGGEVKVNGKFWMAVLDGDKTIEKGSKILVKDLKGIKLVVKMKEVDD